MGGKFGGKFGGNLEESIRSDQRAKSRAAGYHETVNGDLKMFQCLNVMFRHALQDHKVVFEACVFPTQLGCMIHDVRFKVKH